MSTTTMNPTAPLIDDAPKPVRLLTYKQAAEALQVSEGTIYNLVTRGDLPAVRFGPVKVQRVKRRGKWVEVKAGGAVRIDTADLAAFVEAGKARVVGAVEG